MEESGQLRYLKIALVLIGAFCVVGVYPLTIYWPSGWGGTRMALRFTYG
jgi:hypothetical protein